VRKAKDSGKREKPPPKKLQAPQQKQERENEPAKLPIKTTPYLSTGLRERKNSGGWEKRGRRTSQPGNVESILFGWFHRFHLLQEKIASGESRTAGNGVKKGQ